MDTSKIEKTLSKLSKQKVKKSNYKIYIGFIVFFVLTSIFNKQKITPVSSNIGNNNIIANKNNKINYTVSTINNLHQKTKSWTDISKTTRKIIVARGEILFPYIMLNTPPRHWKIISNWLTNTYNIDHSNIRDIFRLGKTHKYGIFFDKVLLYKKIIFTQLTTINRKMIIKYWPEKYSLKSDLTFAWIEQVKYLAIKTLGIEKAKEFMIDLLKKQ